jgi:hypothetical protein
VPTPPSDRDVGGRAGTLNGPIRLILPASSRAGSTSYDPPGGQRGKMALVEGEAVVTGGARGVGRAHALAFADAGARVVANDLGCEVEGTGSSVGPAGEVVDEIRAMGGEAVAGSRW